MKDWELVGNRSFYLVIWNAEFWEFEHLKWVHELAKDTEHAQSEAALCAGQSKHFSA